MIASPLLAEIPEAIATAGEYRGAQVALRWSGEPEALAADAIELADWSWRSRVAISGPEARKWLNGIVTANVRDLLPGRACPSFFLDAKGHALYFFDLVARADDSFLVLCDQDAVAGLIAQLRHYLFRARVEIADLSAAGPSFAIRGPDAASRLAAAGFPSLPAAAGTWTEAAADAAEAAVPILHWLIGEPRAETTGRNATFELLVNTPSAREVWHRIRAHNAQPVGALAEERARIRRGVPRPGVDIRATDLASETGQLQAVGLNKGCYIGQEIVERIRARGAVHRRLRHLHFAGSVAPRAKIVADGHEVGIVTSAAPLDGTGFAALGYLRNEAATAPFACEGVPGRVLDSPAA